MSGSSSIFQVYYEREYDYREDTELDCGIFRSREEAEEAVRNLSTKPGFKDFSEGFRIDELRFDAKTGWEDGFFTEVGPPPKDADAEYFDLPFWMSRPRKQESK